MKTKFIDEYIIYLHLVFIVTSLYNMGGACSHSNLKPISKIEEYDGESMFWYYEVATVQCQDCHQEFKATRTIGRSSNTDYTGWKINEQ